VVCGRLAFGIVCRFFLKKLLPTRQRIRKVRIRCRGRPALPAVNEVEKPLVCQEVRALFLSFGSLASLAENSG
jgi:hypothetical protein